MVTQSGHKGRLLSIPLHTHAQKLIMCFPFIKVIVVLKYWFKHCFYFHKYIADKSSICYIYILENKLVWRYKL